MGWIEVDLLSLHHVCTVVHESVHVCTNTEWYRPHFRVLQQCVYLCESSQLHRSSSSQDKPPAVDAIGSLSVGYQLLSGALFGVSLPPAERSDRQVHIICYQH